MQAGVPIVIPAFGPFPGIELHSILVGLHLMGLCFGLGGATMLYFWIFRWLRWGHLPVEIVRTFTYLGKVVTVGLTLLWVSGLGFLLLDWLTAPEKLANEKIWAKLVIVTALSINGLVLHSRITPLIDRSGAVPLLSQEARRSRVIFILTGAVSGASWYTAFALGILHELNGTVSCTALLTAWAGLIVLAAGTTATLLAVTQRRVPSSFGHSAFAEAASEPS